MAMSVSSSVSRDWDIDEIYREKSSGGVEDLRRANYTGLRRVRKIAGGCR
jgi:hypothetical protein